MHGHRTEAIRYLDHHPEFSAYPGGNIPPSGDLGVPEDEEVKTRREFQELLSSLLLNSALGLIKLAGAINLRTAISLTNRAVEIALSDAHRGGRSQPVTEISDNNNHQPRDCTVGRWPASLSRKRRRLRRTWTTLQSLSVTIKSLQRSRRSEQRARPIWSVKRPR